MTTQQKFFAEQPGSEARNISRLLVPEIDPLPFMPGIRLWTSRYQRKDLAELGLVPVRTTVGYPRFKLGYRLEEHVPELAPERSMLGLADDAEFGLVYTAKLEGIGVDRLQTILAAIQARRSGRSLVFCCFENVLSGESCHRRWLAALWLAQTGERVPELA